MDLDFDLGTILAREPDGFDQESGLAGVNYFFRRIASR
jgi:hypothetical protein